MHKMDKIDKSVTKCCPYICTLSAASGVASVEAGSGSSQRRRDLGPRLRPPVTSHWPVLTDDGKCLILVSVEMVTFRMHLLETGQ